ncbi:MAG: hypothetical protein HY716_00295 [Planctomycetes bacterium]|nr:hypothetical protein [Planctomycetota bacterium]
MALLCVALAAFLGAVGQFLIKAGSESKRVLLDFRVWTGMACYLLVMALFVYAFRRGGTVTVLYPVYASTFIWAAVIARVMYGQPILPVNIVGMALLVTGMFLMGIQT